MFPIAAPQHPFKALLPNTQGVDYVVGDIHGHFERLGAALKKMGFDPNRDRLIAVGDLVDRGRHSDVASQWIEEPFFHSVRGNHEELYLGWRARRHDREEQEIFEEECYFPNGGAWVRGLEEAEHQKFETQLATLPYFLAITLPDGRTVGVVHAELPDGASWPSLIGAELNEEMVDSMLWGRERILTAMQRSKGEETSSHQAMDGNRIAGLDALLVGHVVVSKPVVLGNILYLDTGGWRDKGKFTVISLNQALDAVNNKKRLNR